MAPCRFPVENYFISYFFEKEFDTWLHISAYIIGVDHAEVPKANVFLAVVHHVDETALSVAAAVQVVLACQVAHDGSGLNQLEVAIAQQRQLPEFLCKNIVYLMVRINVYMKRRKYYSMRLAVCGLKAGQVSLL